MFRSQRASYEPNTGVAVRGICLGGRAAGFQGGPDMLYSLMSCRPEVRGFPS